MATFLDIGVLGFFGSIFTFLLVYVVIFAFLSYMKMFGEGRQGWHAIIALAVAALALMSKAAVAFLSFVTPWFIVLFFVLFFIMFAVRMFGVGEDAFKGPVAEQAWPWILVFGIVIVLFGLGHAMGQTALEQGTGTPGSSSPAETTDAGTDTGSGSDTGASASPVGSKGSTATSDFQQNLYNTIFHPKVLGMIFLMVIATVTIAFLAQRTAQ